jgi:hypothetical protein
MASTPLRVASSLLLSLLAVACATAPEVKPLQQPPEVTGAELEVVSQSLTDCTIRLKASVQSPEVAVFLEKARYEFVVDGKVLTSGEQALGVRLPQGGSEALMLEQNFTYVKDADDLRAMDARGGSLLMALRGTIVGRTETFAGEGKPPVSSPVEIPFARGREVRTPRLPHLTLVDHEAGRFSETEVQVLFHLGVVNPNPFLVTISGLSYTVVLADKQVVQGTQGQGEKISPAGTGVFDVQATINEDTHGKDVKKLIKGLKLPFKVTGLLRTALYEEPLEATGEIKLNPPR